MNFLYQSALAEALGWSLIDSLWQMGATWLFYIIITRNGNRFSSQQRHTLALIGSAVGMVLFILSLFFNYYSVSTNTNYFILPFYVKFVPFISFLYVLAVAFFSLRLLLQISSNKNIYHRDLVHPDCELLAFVSDMCERSGIVKKISIWISDKVESPLTIGFWKPVILLPVAVFSHLTCRQVEAVIMHELHHIKRNDYMINIFLTIAELVFFFNPFARMMFASVKKERENRCDDYVIASGFDAWEYSQALYILGRYRNEKNNLAVAATGEGKQYLLERIRRIMKRNNPAPSVLKPFFAFFLCLFVAGFGARHKQIPTLPNIVGGARVATQNKVKPIVFYLEEKRITITPSEENARNPDLVLSQKKIKAPSKVVIQKKGPVLKTLSNPEVIEEPADEDPDLPVGTYVAAPKVIGFTILDPAEPVVPEIVCENPQPYVQKSAFYFTEVDTTAGKKVIVL